jgi:hypothetical protein
MLVLQHLIHEPMTNVDATRIRVSKIAETNFSNGGGF